MKGIADTSSSGPKATSRYDRKSTRPTKQRVLAGGQGDPPVATIDITFDPGAFVNIISTGFGPGDPRLTEATWTLREQIPGVIEQDAPQGTLKVNATVDIDFKLASPLFTLAGVAFRRVRGGGPGNGRDDLPREHIRVTDVGDGTSTIRVRNLHRDTVDLKSSWDFFIFVQNEDGDIGIIDPDIENQHH